MKFLIVQLWRKKILHTATFVNNPEDE
jgi:hypothetical protein